jgi:hypothetical protein
VKNVANKSLYEPLLTSSEVCRYLFPIISLLVVVQEVKLCNGKTEDIADVDESLELECCWHGSIHIGEGHDIEQDVLESLDGFRAPSCNHRDWVLRVCLVVRWFSAEVAEILGSAPRMGVVVRTYVDSVEVVVDQGNGGVTFASRGPSTATVRWFSDLVPDHDPISFLVWWPQMRRGTTVSSRTTGSSRRRVLFRACVCCLKLLDNKLFT